MNYIVMEKIRGGSLGERLERDGPLPEAEVIELGITLADALQHAHDGGVLHLDLKPENILMSQFGRPKLVDFGIAAMIHEDTSTSTIRATPSFADPQVLEGHPGTVSSDVYGLAATIYTLLSGTPPYSAGPSGLYQTMRRVALDPVPTVQRDDVSPELTSVLRRAMAKDPGQRPASMREFADELRAVTAPPPATSIPQWGPGPDPCGIRIAGFRSLRRPAQWRTGTRRARSIDPPIRPRRHNRARHRIRSRPGLPASPSVGASLPVRASRWATSPTRRSPTGR